LDHYPDQCGAMTHQIDVTRQAEPCCKSASLSLAATLFLRLAWAPCLRPLSQPHVSTADQADLIGFLQGLPEGRKRRGIRYPQWFLLLVAILGILSGCLSVKDLERFAARHHGALNAVLGLGIKGSPTDSTFL
jgi:hypothetical protein